VYLDTYSSGWHVYDNLIYDMVLGSYMVNGGTDNLFENNICLRGKEAQSFLETWPKYEMFGDIVQHNIFAYQGKTADVHHVNRFTKANATYRENLIWSAEGKISVGVGRIGSARQDSWEMWRELGQDEDSVIADPQFVDAAKPSWQLKPTSPAFKSSLLNIFCTFFRSYRCVACRLEALKNWIIRSFKSWVIHACSGVSKPILLRRNRICSGSIPRP
jgi:hypothetical protein